MFQSNLEKWDIIYTYTQEECAQLGYSTKRKKDVYKIKCKHCGEEKTITKGALQARITLCPNGCHGVGKKSSGLVVKGYDDLATTHPHLVQYFVDKSQATKVKAKGNQEVQVKCPLCGHEKTVEPKYLTQHNGMKCPVCEKHSMSNPERIMSAVLDVLNIPYKQQLTLDNGKHYYDFYIKEYNLIIEMHGEQHYEDGRQMFRRTYEEEHENDLYKWMYATLKLGQDLKYVVVNCKDSRFNSVQKNIVLQLSTIFNFNELNWNDVFQHSVNDDFKTVVKLYNEGKYTGEIAKIIGKGQDTVSKYLKEAHDKGLCHYVASDYVKNLQERIIVVDENYNVIGDYESVSEAKRKTTITNIQKILNHEIGKDNFINSLKLKMKIGFFKYDSEDYNKIKHLIAPIQ